MKNVGKSRHSIGNHTERDVKRMNELHSLSILLLCFSAALFLYAWILYRTQNSKLIAYDYAVKMKDPKAYARQFAKVIALVATAPLLSALVGLFTDSGKWTFRVLLGGVILAIAIGVDMMKKVT